MGLAPGMAVATPELIGVLAWWGVVLAGPLVLLRRWMRRRINAGRDCELGGEASGGHVDVVRLSDPVPCDGPRASAPVWRSGSPGEALPAGRAAVRLAPGTLAPLCRYVDFRRRLALAVSELERKLSVLPKDRWRIEPYPLTGERRNTLLVLGETGVFVISATYAPGHWDDLITVNGLARKIKSLLPGYPGEVRPAVCHPFSSLRPRIWYREGKDGKWIAAWVVGGNSVIEWLEHFGRDHGLRPAYLERFDELSKPNWLKPAIPTPPSWPPVLDWAPPAWQE